MRVSAILWDGFNKILGDLEIEFHQVSFHFLDFANTDLSFEIEFQEIKEVQIHLIFDLNEKGLKIVSKSGSINFFVMQDATKFKREILKKMRCPD